MRSDWPVGFNEDCIEPPGEIFEQFIENTEMTIDDIVIEEEFYPIGQFEVEDNEIDSDHDDDIQFEFNDFDLSHSSDFLSIHSESLMQVVSVSDGESQCVETPSDNEAESVIHVVCYEVASHQFSWLNDIFSLEHSGDVPDYVHNVYLEMDIAEALQHPVIQALGNPISIYSLKAPANQPSCPFVPCEECDDSTIFSNEGNVNLLPGLSSDRLFSGSLPVNPPCSPELCAADENSHSDDLPVHTSCKSSNSFGEFLTDDNSVSFNATSAKSEQDPNSLLLQDSVTENLDCEESQPKSEITVTDDIDSESSVGDTDQSENNSMVENEPNNETLTDKAVSNLKRKGSVEDNVLNKVPKYSSDTSTDSVQESVEKYCKVLSSNSDKQASSDGDKAEAVPSAVAEDNVILTLEKAVVKEKPKSR